MSIHSKDSTWFRHQGMDVCPGTGTMEKPETESVLGPCWKSTKPSCSVAATWTRLWWDGRLNSKSWHWERGQVPWHHPCTRRGGKNTGLRLFSLIFFQETPLCLSSTGTNTSNLEIRPWLARWQAAGLLARVQVCSTGKRSALYSSKA